MPCLARLHMSLHIYIYIYMHQCIHIYIYIYINTYIHMYIHTCRALRLRVGGVKLFEALHNVGPGHGKRVGLKTGRGRAFESSSWSHAIPMHCLLLKRWVKLRYGAGSKYILAQVHFYVGTFTYVLIFAPMYTYLSSRCQFYNHELQCKRCKNLQRN
jgi:hypothetical protein